MKPTTTALATIAGGVTVGLLFSVMIANFMGERDATPWRFVALQQVAFWGIWGLLVAAMWQVVSRTEAEVAWRRRTALGATAVAAWLAHATLLYLAAAAWTPGRHVSPVSFGAFLMRNLYIDSIVLAGIVALMMAMRQRRRAHEDARRASSLALQLTRAKLRALEAQLHPHFLFNALHTISMLARANDVERIPTVTAGLGDLLRAMLDSADDSETTVRDELALAERYLAIERIRFHDRLDASSDAAPDALDARLPRFILQPLIENAMRHGLGPKVEPGRLRLHAERVGALLVVTVTDDGIGLPEAISRGAAAPPGALGLRITRERLAGLYGDRASLRVERHTAGGTVATVSVPWHTSPMDDGVLATPVGGYA